MTSISKGVFGSCVIIVETVVTRDVLNGPQKLHTAKGISSNMNGTFGTRILTKNLNNRFVLFRATVRKTVRTHPIVPACPLICEHTNAQTPVVGPKKKHIRRRAPVKR